LTWTIFHYDFELYNIVGLLINSVGYTLFDRFLLFDLYSIQSIYYQLIIL